MPSSAEFFWCVLWRMPKVDARYPQGKSLKLIALDDERTLQDVMTEAINDVLTKHGRSPVA